MRPPHRQPSDNAAGHPAGGDAAAADTLLQSSGLLTVVLDERARIVSFNKAFSQFVGKSPEPLQDAVFKTLVIPEDEWESFERDLRNVRDGSDGSARIDSWLTAGGDQRPVQWWLSCLDARPRAGSGYAVTAIDLSLNHEAWDRLAEKEARLESILDTAVDGIVTIDEGGIIESTNLATERIFGYEARELIGQNVKILMPEPYRHQHDTYLSNYLNTGEKKIIGIGREVEGRHKDGTTFPLDLAVSEFYVAGGRRFMGLMRDISERKRAEQEARRHMDELAHASRLSALGEMATGIAHEVNQPLAAIVSYAQACSSMLGSARADEFLIADTLEQIAAQGRRAGDIIHHLRQLVRKGEPARLPVEVNVCVRAVLALFANEIKSTGVTVAIELGDPLPRVRANRVQIEQVLLNLVRNALDVLALQEAAARRLSITTRRTSGSSVEVCVADTGPGLEGIEPERLFETFYTTKPEGLGVGLSISRSIIGAHGGRMWARENRHSGLDVFFTLPGRSDDEG